MRLITKRLLCLCLCTCTIVCTKAQSSFQAPANTDIDRMINIYHSWAGPNDAIYNGREYERYPFYINNGIPYFEADTLAMAQLVYDGIQYNETLLLYDLVADELITRTYDGKKLIKLVKQKVDSFQLNGGRFISVHNGDKNIPEGYYQVLNDNNTQVLKKEIRRIESQIRSGEQLERNIKSKTTYYVKENNEYRKVSNSKIIKHYGQLTQ